MHMGACGASLEGTLPRQLMSRCQPRPLQTGSSSRTLARKLSVRCRSTNSRHLPSSMIGSMAALTQQTPTARASARSAVASSASAVVTTASSVATRPGQAVKPASRTVKQRVQFPKRTSQGGGLPGKRGGTGSGKQQPAGEPVNGPGRKYNLFTGFPFPLGPLSERKTFRTELVKGAMWAFEQPQNLAGSNVHTNVRMTALRLSDGSLLIYAPIAPTRECVALVKELGIEVKHIVLPTFAYEHKVFVGPFSRKFKGAQIYVAPEQWSFPLRLPLPFFGINRAVPIKAKEMYPWSSDLDHRVLTINISKGVGPYSEVAMFHKSSGTLLLVDAAVCVPRSPPPIVPKWALQDAGGSSFFVRLLYGNVSSKQAASQDAFEARGPEIAEAATEQLGWQRMCLQVLFFAPKNLLSPQQSFGRFAGRLIVSPVVRVLVFSKTPKEVAAWVEDIASSWRFRQIVPCHLHAPIAAGPNDLREAFAWAYKLAGRPVKRRGLPTAPVLLSKLRNLLPGGKTAPARGGASSSGGGGVEEEDLFDAEDLAALQTLSGALRRAGVTIEDP